MAIQIRFLLLVTSMFCFATEQRYTIYSLKEALPLLEKSDSTTLIIFDIDGTLVISNYDITPTYVIEQESVQILNTLRECGYIIWGLTGARSGSYDTIEHCPTWRHADLKQLGFCFSEQYPDTVFSNLPPNYNTYPVIYHGIAFANELEKGLILEALLEAYNLKPSQIIFFDDYLPNIDSVAAACKKLNIPCTLFHFKGAEKLYPITAQYEQPQTV